jgi:amino acid adenylation domain-containing protein
VLARHADVDDVLFGAVRACRRSSVSSADRIVGLMMNTLPVRVRVDRTAALVPWLQGIARDRRALRHYEHTPLARVQAWSEIAPPLPLFESLVNFSPRTIDADLRRIDPSWERRSVRQIGQTNVPLALVAWGGERLTLRLQYDGARVTAAAAAVLAEQLAEALESLPRVARVGDVALAAPNAPVVAALPAPPLPVSTAFVAHARRAPGAVAVCDGTEALTYAALLERADRVAAALRVRGVTAGTPVAMTFERSVEAIVVLLGILRAGGAYVPLVPDLPDARWAKQLACSGARFAVTTSALRARLPAGVVALCIDRPGELESCDPGALPELNLDDVAYVLFTSGSTGEPKGVAITHGNLAAYAAAIAQRLGLQSGSAAAFASVSTLGADLGNTAVFGALTTGGTLHLVPPETASDPAGFAAYASAHPIDVLKITPSHLRALLDGGSTTVLPRRWLVLGGEAASPAFAETLLAAGTCRILNHYGPTETTVGACTFELTVDALAAARAAGAQTVPIGAPLPGAWLDVLDADGASVPVGVAGELHIGGTGVARGYVQDAVRTGERFVQLPGRGRAYRTGDRARRLPSGDLEFLGRYDRQVKVRGYRVEPGEIEAVLLAHPAIAAAAVIVRTDGAEPQLDAYVVASGAASGDVAALARAHLTARLPAYLIPARIAVLPALPLTANGKIDRASLPAADAPPVADEPPRSATERTLAAVWRDVLKCPAIGRHADFFALGGHSLAAIRVLGRISRAFGVRLPLRALFDAPTLAELAAAIDGGVRSAPVAAIAPSARRSGNAS